VSPDNKYLGWQVSGADRCEASNSSNDISWSGSLPIRDGQEFTTPINPIGRTVYTLECFKGSLSTKKSVTVEGDTSVGNIPTAKIISVGGLFIGEGTDTDGVVTKVQWAMGENKTLIYGSASGLTVTNPAAKITDERAVGVDFEEDTMIYFRVQDDDGNWSEYDSKLKEIAEEIIPPQYENTCGEAAKNFSCEEEWPDDCHSICCCPSLNYVFCKNDSAVPEWINLGPDVEIIGSYLEYPVLEQGDTFKWKCGTANCTATRDDCREIKPEIDTATNLCGPAGTNDSTNPRTYSAYATEYTDSLCVYGDPDPASATSDFPNQGATSSWTCYDANGANPMDCYARRNSVSSVANVCGSAGSSDSNNPRVYSATDTSFTGNLCTILDPATAVSFPVQGGSVSWVCEGVSGGSSQTCYAERNSITTIITDDEDEDDNDDNKTTTIKKIYKTIKEVIVPSFPKAGFWFGN
jgi:hypothetical protein